MIRERLGSTISHGTNIRGALGELFTQEFSYSTGYLATILNGCLFAPSLLTFWFVNGVIDFSTAIAIGAVTTPAGLQLRLLAYVLLVPTFLLVRMSLHLLHPDHRTQVLNGSCPSFQPLSLDWFSLGVLATGLPLALQNLGPWIGMNTVFLVGIFVVPRSLPDHRAKDAKLLALVLGSALFLYANYGAVAAPPLPSPATILGPVATFALDAETTERLFRLVNSLSFGPFAVAVFGVSANHVLTRPEFTDIPIVSHALPRRDPDVVIATSAALGTAFYLAVVGLITGRVILVP
ncbi:cupredoxin domain-containing protein [Haloplanus natans]|uniref:hypothetical protein n=1 Tax=Haloplanus natans TaxID=376171 RepID=UPI000677DC87|nr:hypothetical protein [Haloplanus natans]